MKSSGWNVLWDCFEAASVGILLAAPPLVLRNILNAGNKISIVFPATILTWVILTVFFTNTPWGARRINAQIGLWGSSCLWLIFVISTDVNRLMLIKYGVVGVTFAIIWLLLEYDERDSISLSLIIGVVAIMGTLAIAFISGGVGLILFILCVILLGFATYNEISWISLVLIIAAIVFYWWPLLDLQQAASSLRTILWITIPSVISISGAGLLAWKPNRRDTSRRTAWSLLASLVWVATFLWLGNRSEVSVIISCIALLVALAINIWIFVVRTLFEENISANLIVRPRVFQSQATTGREFLIKKEFRRAIPALQEAIEAWSEEGMKEFARIRIMLVYALIQTGHSADALVDREIIHDIVNEFRTGDSYSKRISLTLLLASKNQKELFTVEQAPRHAMWQALIDQDEVLRDLVQQTIQSAAPFSIEALMEDFQKEDHPVIQKHILQLLHKWGKTRDIFSFSKRRGSFPNLFNVFESANPKTHSLARTVIVEEGVGASQFLLEGLDRQNRCVREFSMQRLIELKQLKYAVEHIKQNIPNLEPKILLTVLQARPGPVQLDPGTSLGDLIAGLGNPRGLDVLANLQDSPTNQESITEAWKNIHGALRNQLMDVIWSNTLEDARHAAHLYYQDPYFIQNALQMLQTGNFEEKYYAANLTARVMYLLMHELPQEKSEILNLRQDISLKHASEPKTQIKVQLTGESNGTPALPIPVVNIELGKPMLLLVNHEKYRLDVQMQASTSQSIRLKFFAITDKLDIPQYAREFNSEKPDSSPLVQYQLFPDEPYAFEDLLTLTMRVNGRGQRLMAYKLFVCDPYVLNGLKV
ncbi:MAG TPA: hypothetical protein VI338_01120 [Nitrososphaera sp.]|nr:hypothetical protein [Nitrososphaera sp.]